MEHLKREQNAKSVVIVPVPFNFDVHEENCVSEKSVVSDIISKHTYFKIQPFSGWVFLWGVAIFLLNFSWTCGLHRQVELQIISPALTQRENLVVFFLFIFFPDSFFSLFFLAKIGYFKNFAKFIREHLSRSLILQLF